MTTMKKRLLALCSAILLTLLLAGCAQAQGPAGVLTLAVNPEIRIAYDERGRTRRASGSSPTCRTTSAATAARWWRN